MTLRKKLLITIACLSVILCTLVTGTIAWLTAETTTITNTFTPSNISISLTETTGGEYKMVPGTTIKKDPVVTVAANSEACWLFVKVEEKLGAWVGNSAEFSNYLTYSVITGSDGWTQLMDNNNNPVSGIYYREVGAFTTAQEFHVLVDDKITVSPSVTKGMMDMLYNQDGSVKEAVLPTLTFTAYACQREGFDSAAAAWTEITTNP